MSVHVRIFNFGTMYYTIPLWAQANACGLEVCDLQFFDRWVNYCFYRESIRTVFFYLIDQKYDFAAHYANWRDMPHKTLNTPSTTHFTWAWGVRVLRNIQMTSEFDPNMSRFYFWIFVVLVLSENYDIFHPILISNYSVNVSMNSTLLFLHQCHVKWIKITRFCAACRVNRQNKWRSCIFDPIKRKKFGPNILALDKKIKSHTPNVSKHCAH